MPITKYLKGSCQFCGGHFEFPAEIVGTSIACPHCSKETELMLELPSAEPAIPRSTIIWTGITVFLLVLGLFGALAALKRAEKAAVARRQPVTATPLQTNIENAQLSPDDEVLLKADFQRTSVTLQKNPGSSLVYAIGTLTNKAARQRFGVKLILDLFDEAGVKVGETTDYQQLIEPGGQWNFRALVVAPKATSARIDSIHEDR
jgi:hypothetical protein